MPEVQDRLPRLAALAAAVESGDAQSLRAAAAAVLELDDAEAVRETVRQMSLFSGFPRALRALGELAGLLPAVAGTSAPVERAPLAARTVADDLDHGRELFAQLYGRDADAVLPHLEALDPLLASWILGHAYGRVLGRPGLTIEERERLAVLALAASGCWAQCASHARIALRLGVPRARLLADTTAGGWLGATAAARAAELIAGLPDGLAEESGR